MQTYKDSLIAEWRGKIIEVGKEAKIFDSEWFDKFCQGKMTDKEKTELWGNILSKVVTSAITAATAYGLASMKAASGGMFVPAYSMPGYGTPSVSGAVPGA